MRRIKPETYKDLAMISNHSIDVEAESATLKPCPFCGGAAQTDFIEGASYIIECYVCNAHAGFMDSAQEAVEAWNRRTPVSGEVAEGFALVPRKPTPEMLDALYVTPDFVGSTIIRHSVDKLPAAYDAMLAVAPLPVPRVGGNTNPETPQISAQGIDHAKLAEGEQIAFEAWAAPRAFDIRRQNTKYLNTCTGYAWKGWQARGQQAGGAEE